MESSLDISNPQLSSKPAPTLQVDFSWKKFKALITEHGKPSSPIYIVEFQTIKSPSVIFKSVTHDEMIGTGTLHPFSINADFDIHGQKGKLKALKRWQTQYSHLSHAFSDDGSPSTMKWTTTCGFGTWDFICMDEKQMPVAKFSANGWALRKVGNIEFLGPKATSLAVRDEIVVTGLTLYYCMLLRSTSILSFFGAIFAQPGPLDQHPPARSQPEVIGEHGQE